MLAAFLDRDGVLNRAILRHGKPFPPRTRDELEILVEAREACGMLREAGFMVICVTNQPDIARGTAAAAEVAALNDLLKRELRLDDVRVCPHDDADGCHCRKPKPGLLIAAAEEFDIDLASSYIVGDRWRDIAAGEAAGCGTVFIDRGYNEKRPDHADFTTTSVAEAARWIVRQSSNPTSRRWLGQ